MAEQSFHIDGGIEASGIITATTFKKEGGHSNQFLKADGSTDSRTFSQTDTTITTFQAHDGDTASKKRINMVDSNAQTVGVVTFVAGNNIQLSRNDNEITITGTIADSDTTYSVSAADGSAANKKTIRLTAGGSGSGTDDVTFVGGHNINLSRTNDEITIDTVSGTIKVYDISAEDGSGNKKIIRLGDSDGGTDDIALDPGVGISLVRNGQEISIGSTETLTSLTDRTNTTSNSVTIGGVNVTGDLDVDGATELDHVNVTGLSTFFHYGVIDGGEARWGTDDDLKIYYNGNVGIVTCKGALRFYSDNGLNWRDSYGNYLINANVSGGTQGVQLYCAGDEKFETNIYGTHITGVCTVTQDVNVGGALTVTGDLTVNGTTTQINTTNLQIEDSTIQVRTGANVAPGTGGLSVIQSTDGSSNVTSSRDIRYNSTTSKWQYSNDGTSYNNINQYTHEAVDDGNNVKLRLSDGSTNDDITITAGTDVTIDQVSASAFRINSTASITDVPAGIIALWSGASNAIPTGWTLCDGNNSTPDLRDKFLIGAGSGYAVNATGGSANSIVVDHSHGIGNISGNSSNTGDHTHGDGNYGTNNTGNHNHSYNSNHNANTGNNGDHSHNANMPNHNHVFPGDDMLSNASGTGGWNNRTTGSWGYDAVSNASGGGTIYRTSDTSGSGNTSNAGGHSHNFNFNISGNTGNNGGHSHNINGASGSGGSHSHNINVSGNTGSTGNSGTNANLPPYYALCYIMKT